MFIRANTVLGVKTKDGTSPISPGSVVEVDDETGRRLVDAGAAREAEKFKRNAGGFKPQARGAIYDKGKAAEASEGQETAQNEDVPEDVDLNSLSFEELKTMARELGVFNGARMKSKASLIEAIEGAADLPDITPEVLID